jgi:hypothetical protein
MPPSIQRVTSVTMIGTLPGSSVLLNWLEGIVTELDFNTVPVGTAIDTHYAAEGVTFELVDKNGARIGSVVTAVGPAVNSVPPGGPPVPDPDPNDPKGSASKVIGGFDDTSGIIRATFKHPQLYVAIDVKPGVVTTEFFKPDPGSIPFLKILGLPPVFPHHGSTPVLATINFPLQTTDTNFESWQTMDFLSTSPTPNIGGIEFSGHFAGSGAPVNAFFDLLRFAHHLPLSAIDEVG